MKNKKKLIAAGAGGVVCLGLLCFYLFGFGGTQSPADPEPEPEAAGPGVEVNIGPITEGNAQAPTGSADETDPIINPEKEDSNVTVPLVDPVERPAEADPDPDPDKHERGDEDEPPEPETPAPAPPVTVPETEGPTGGDTNSSGQVYIPGFGWITPGDGNQVDHSGSDGDINKMVGDM